MVIEGLVVLICTILFFFTLYTLCREDYVFLRKNITLEEVYNIAFVVLFSTAFFSRLFYVVFQFKPTYLNPLVFFLIPYFPGLSLVGGLIGGIITLVMLTKQKKYPRGRFVDFFCFALLSTFPLGYGGMLLYREDRSLLVAVLPVVYYAILFGFFYKALLPRFLKGQMRDGMLGLLILMNYSLFTAALYIVYHLDKKTSFLQPELFVIGALFLLSLFFYLRQGASLSLKPAK